MNEKLYQMQWLVPSRSQAGVLHKVSLTNEGRYVCGCWKFRTTATCHHIEAVQTGKVPQLVYWKVQVWVQDPSVITQSAGEWRDLKTRAGSPTLTFYTRDGAESGALLYVFGSHRTRIVQCEKNGIPLA